GRPGPAEGGPVAAAVIAAVARATAGAAAGASRAGTFLAHLFSLERDLVGIERARRARWLGLPARHLAAAHPALAVAAAAQELEVVAADVQAGLLDVVLVHVRARAEAPVHVDLLTLLDDLLRGLGLLAPAADAVPVGLLRSFAAAVGDAVHCDGEVADRAAVGGHAHLGIAPDVADDRDLGHRCHLAHFLNTHSSRRITM